MTATRIALTWAGLAVALAPLCVALLRNARAKVAEINRELSPDVYDERE